MQLFHTFVAACVIFASSAIANPAVASQSASNTPGLILCWNKEKLTHKVDDFCVPAASMGIKGSRECLEDGGRGYYCTDEKQNGICVDLYLRPRAPAGNIGGDYTGGECFSAPIGDD